MISLRLNIDMQSLDNTIIVRLRKNSFTDEFSDFGYDAIFQYQSGNWSVFELHGFELKVEVSSVTEVHNDVLLIHPGAKLGHRLIRASSPHNTLLITEQCDQLCVMCSQPPKRNHVDLFKYFLEAISVAPSQMHIGISGGEPLLHKQKLFEFLSRAHSLRPDLKFHVLTNGQHFSEQDVEFLSSAISQNILWAIPIYSSDGEVHDRIVGKSGAYSRLLETMVIFSSTTATFELRTVLLNSNVGTLPNLADFITTNIPFADFWAIMQLEPIGFGRKVWDSEFVDTSVSFDNVARALDIAAARDTEVRLYNFPLCTIPSAFQHFANLSISDWKQKYLPLCQSCKVKHSCAGFFEWYNEKKGFKHLVPE